MDDATIVVAMAADGEAAVGMAEPLASPAVLKTECIAESAGTTRRPAANEGPAEPVGATVLVGEPGDLGPEPVLMRGSGEGRGHLEKGDILKNRYEVISLIGDGGMSRVYLAMDRELVNKQWAIKEVDRLACDPTGRPIEQSLANEARLLSGLDHPNIVRIVDMVKTDDFIYVVMDHVEGQTLADVVSREGRQREEDVRRWMLQVCDALDYLHRQRPAIIYRDLKPSNIMLRPDGYIKLIDLGVAREYRDGAQRDTIAFGTTGYAAPEQYAKAQSDVRTDIYGAGATMWHLLAGEVPPVEFPLPDVRSKNPQVSDGFAEVIIPSCCQIERSRRYQTCGELAADLKIYEDLTREYREGQLRRVRVFAAMLVAGMVCIIVGLTSLAVGGARLAWSYESQMRAAALERASNTEGSERAYLAAIAYRPGEVDPYLGLIECYKADASFTVEESSQLQDVYQQNLAAIRRSARYSELEYEIGRLYWYFYTYGDGGDGSAGADGEDNRTARIRASAEHFRVAAQDETFENAGKARIYDVIARFTVNIAAAIKTDEDDCAMYAEYWDGLVALASWVSQEGNETVRLDGHALVANAVETYMDKFRAAGVGEDAAEALYVRVRDSLLAMQGSDAEAEARRTATLARLEGAVRRKITTTYGARG